MKKVNRDCYIFWESMIILKRGTNFQKLFHKWYVSNNSNVPDRIHDFLKRKAFLKDRL